jgi:hypothetical protein
LDDLDDESARRTLVVLNGALNCSHDVQRLLQELHSKMARTGRLAIVHYSRLLCWLRTGSSCFGVRRELPFSTFLSAAELENLARLAGFEVVRVRPIGYCPARFFGLGRLANRAISLMPFVRWLCLARLVVFRPLVACSGSPSLSVVIPARNERGNIANALRHLPEMPGVDLEIVFVEGNSTDGTWQEIQRQSAAYADRYRIQCLQQSGRGKADAVRLGFAHATGDLVAILDADLTVPAELLRHFYEAYCLGLGDFVNGNRFVYRMEPGAMKWLNRLGNSFFAALLSFVLDVRLGDSLCGTKLFAREDYERFVRWRNDFGDVDPFGDFELLFPAATLALGIVDLPVRYRARVYGRTQIRRFRDGWRLLRMTLLGLAREKVQK